MSDKRRFCDNLLITLGIMALVIQTVFAIFWCISVGSKLSGDIYSVNYIEAAKTLKVDNFMGILYAFLVRLLGHGWILKMFQASFLYVSVFFMLRAWGLSKLVQIVVAGLVVTNPFILYMENSVRPEAVILGSLLIAIIGVKHNNPVLFCVFLTVLGMLNRDFIVAAGIFATGFFIRSLIKKNKRLAWGISAVACVALPVIFCSVSTDEYAYGRAKKTLEYVAVQRLSSGHIHYNSQDLENYTGYTLSDSMMEADKVSDRLASSFAYEYERLMGVEETKGTFKHIAKLDLLKGPRNYAFPIVKDFIKYLFSPFTIFTVILSNETGTHLTSFLNDFTAGSMFLWKSYIIYSLVLGMVFWITGFISFINRKNKEVIFRDISLLFLLSAGFALYATIFAPVGFDFRYVLYSISFGVFSSFISLRGEGD